MEEFELGPNGGLVYCMEYLLANFSWLEDRLRALGSQYILFDCPGQVSDRDIDIDMRPYESDTELIVWCTELIVWFAEYTLTLNLFLTFSIEFSISNY